MEAEPAWLIGERAARALRQELGLGFTPIDIWEIVQQRCVHVAFHDFGSEGGDGLYLWSGDEKTGTALMVINSGKRPARQRFTAAHELGHHEIHRFSGHAVVIADQDIFEPGGNPEEAAANSFAAYLLAPTEDLVAQVKGAHRTVTPRDVVGLMRRYGLSYQAMSYRLLNAKLIGKAKREELLQAGEGQVDRWALEQGFSESTIFPAPAPVPEAITLGALRLYSQRVITEARLAELLNKSREEALATLAEAGLERPDEEPIDEQAIMELLR